MIRKNAETIQVMTGSYHIPYGNYYDVEELIPHEKYSDPHKYANDIAVIKLAKSIERHANTAIVPLGRGRIPEELNLKLELIGWRRRGVSVIISFCLFSMAMFSFHFL